MLVGLCGAHRSGKTTLGAEFARQNRKYTFAATSVSAIMKQHGYDPALDYEMGQRLDIQEIILAELDAFYARAGQNTVFDRTPIDAAAYLLADVRRENVARCHQERIARYLTQCFEVTNRRFGLLIYVPSTLPLIPAAGKAPSDIAYVEHISLLINGLKSDQRMRLKHYSLRRHHTDLEVRVRAVEQCTQQVIDGAARESEEQRASGLVAH